MHCSNKYYSSFSTPLLLLLGLSFCSADKWSGDNNSDNTGGRLRFLAIGDWGGTDFFPYHTQEQLDTADGMAKVAREQEAEFVLALGDNFYYAGLMDDAFAKMRFEQTFERVYNHDELQVPWHIISGNHDYCGDIQQQIMIAADPSNRWSFPDFNYKITKEFHDESNGRAVKLDIIMIDTMHVAGFHCLSQPFDELRPPPEEYFAQPPGPLSLAEASATLSYIESALMNSSDADYILVAGHYPIYSPCSHGNTHELIDKLDPLLREYGVTAYISGHEHCQFHYSLDGMDYLLTGAGMSCCYSADNISNLPREGNFEYVLADSYRYSGSSGVEGGFMSFDVGGDGMKVTIHKEDGSTLYETELRPRSVQFKSSLEEETKAVE
jgi:tartrate-resistant acid phosphatase type 5